MLMRVATAARINTCTMDLNISIVKQRKQPTACPDTAACLRLENTEGIYIILVRYTTPPLQLPHATLGTHRCVHGYGQLILQ